MDFSEAIKQLGSKIKMIFDLKSLEDRKHIQSIKSSLDNLLAEIKGKNNKDVQDAIIKLQEILEDKDLSVKLEAPIVNVPKPDIKVIEGKETVKKLIKTNESLSAIGKILKYIAKRADTTFVENSSPGQAIPVTITDKHKKAFIDAFAQQIIPHFQAPRVKDFNIEIERGKIEGHRIINIEGRNPSLAFETEETIWDQGGIYTYLTEDTQLYVSSSSAADINIPITIEGLDDQYNEVTRTGILNGQNQVAIDGNIFRIFHAVVRGSVYPQGDIYLAESDTLTGGVPDTETKIKAKIIQGRGNTSMGMYTVPAGKTAYGIVVIFVVGKGDDINFKPFGRLQGEIFTSQGEFNLYQNVHSFELVGISLPEKSDLEYRAVAGNAEATATLFLGAYLIDNDAP